MRPASFAFAGVAAAAIGAGLYAYTAFLYPPYAGASGGGMSGLEAGLLVLAALVLVGLGLLLMLAAAIAHWRPRRD